jgi:hypothetical protein
MGTIYKPNTKAVAYVKAAKAGLAKNPAISSGYCLKYQRLFAGIPAKYATASESGKHSPLHLYTAAAPIGAPIYWLQGSNGGTAGHIACYIGDGWCITTDSPKYRYGKRKVTELTKAWHMSAPYWGEKINDVKLIDEVADAKVPVPDSKPESGKKKTNKQIAQEVINGKWGNGDTRKTKLKSAGYDYNAIQKEVKKLLTASTTYKFKVKTKIDPSINIWKDKAGKKKTGKVIKRGAIVALNIKSPSGFVAYNGGYINSKYLVKA